MANANLPKGLVPIRYLNGSPWNGAVTTYYATGGTDIFVGDALALSGGAGAAGLVINGQDCEGMPAVTPVAAGANILGVCVGIVPSVATDALFYASGDRLVLVVDDPNVIFRIQEDAVANSVEAAAIGNNFDLVATAGSTTTGVSAMTLDSSDTSGTATAQLRVLRLSDLGPGKNTIATTSAAGQYATFDVIINEHTFKSTTGV